MRSTQHFHRGLLLIMTQRKKRIPEKHTEIFFEFLIFLEERKLEKEKTKRKKLFTRESSQQAKEKWEIFSVFI